MVGKEAEPPGRRIRSLRRRAGLSQARLAEAAGISVRHQSFIETGRSRPSRQITQRIAESLRLSRREADALLELAGHARTRVPEAASEMRVVNASALPPSLGRSPIGDPLRLDLLRAFAIPRSAPEAAASIGVAEALVREHVRALADAGFLEQVEHQERPGTAERRYRTTATVFRVTPEASDRQDPDSDTEVWVPRMAARASVMLDEKGLVEFAEALHDLFARFDGAEGKNALRFDFSITGAPGSASRVPG